MKFLTTVLRLLFVNKVELKRKYGLEAFENLHLWCQLCD